FNAFGVDLGPDNIRSASEPRPGGYFSPQLFGSAETGLAIDARLSDSAFFHLEGGPALQYVKEQGLDRDIGGGGQGKLEFMYFLQPSIYWSVGADVRSFGSAYTRAMATTKLAIEF